MFPTAIAMPRQHARRFLAKARRALPAFGWVALSVVIAFVVPGSVAVLGFAACNTIRSNGGAAVDAFIDCEAPAIADALPDLVPLVRAEVNHLIDPATNQVDPAKLLADLANVKSNLGRCAIAAAFAALSPNMPATPTHAAGIAQPATHTTWDLVHEQLHWPPLHVAGRVM